MPGREGWFVVFVSLVFIAFAVVLVVAQFVVPRRFAFVPLLVAICHMQGAPVLEVGVSFSICKLVIIAGLLRAARDHTLVGFTRQPLDVVIVLWASWMILSGFAHHPKDHNPLTVRLSLIFDFAGGYLYSRSFLKGPADFVRFAKCLAVVLVPLAVEVLFEKFAHQNFYGLIAGGKPDVILRDGRVRAAGPFRHAILMGTFAATSIVLLVPLWTRHRSFMIAGAVAGVLCILCSTSSGPIVTLFSGASALALWRFRKSVKWIRGVILLGILVLHLIMQAPVWYLMARIDLAGGSTGWHRAELITAALNHLSEWWLVGTDYTRHWIPYGVNWSEYHIDITNYYINMGVTGGLPLMLCFIVILVRAFQMLGRRMREMRLAEVPDELILWCVGSALFAHSFTFLSIYYFDQTNVGLSFLLGVVPGLCAVEVRADSEVAQPQWQHGEGEDPLTA